uniref:Fibronectin type-III domain-containing protein n=1 Tax=Hucho hucho TaxID=62062 RepID=A0A4W5QTK2_9TELE
CVCVCVRVCGCVLSSTEPREAPSEVKASSISSSEIKVTWSPPNPGPGRPRGYEVSYRKDSEQEESGKKTAGNETYMMLTGLEGNSVYLITVRGFNSIGQGPASTASTAKTRKDREYTTHTNQSCIDRGYCIYSLIKHEYSHR